jgi:hypothetical protein
MYNAEDIDNAQVDDGAKCRKAVAKIVDDLDTLPEFDKFPAEYWVYLRPTNPIERTFATVRLRVKVAERPGSPTADIGLATSSSTLHKPAGELSTPRIWSPCCAPESSTKVN